jgi:hypothetical protein
MKPFTPYSAATVNIDVSGSSQSVSLAVRGGPQQVRVYNDGTATAWLNFGLTGLTAATTTGMPIASGACEVLTLPDFGGTVYVAAIAAGATGKIYFTPGYGI